MSDDLTSSQDSEPAPRGKVEDRPVTAAGQESLRTRLVGARAKRGLCPPLLELQLDALPTSEARPGKEERERHLARCAVCSYHLHTWKNSWEGRTALALALGRVGGRALSRTLRGLGSAAARARPAPKADHREKPPKKPASRPASPPRTVEAREFPSPSGTAPPRVEAEWPGESPSFALELPPPVTAPNHLEIPELLVFETPPPGLVPAALLAAVAQRGGAVVTVQGLDEVFDDPDFDSVRAIILARSRPLGEWPAAIQYTRERSPGRTVLAIVPAPRFGPTGLAWVSDPGILVPPVADGDWSPALHRAGWLARP